MRAAQDEGLEAGGRRAWLRRPRGRALVALAALLVAGGGWRAGGWGIERPPRDGTREGTVPPASSPTVEAAVPVEVDTVLRGPLVLAVEAVGRAEASRAARLAAPAAGTVAAVLVAPGQAVSAGRPLVALDDGPSALAVRRAEVERDAALLRYRDLTLLDEDGVLDPAAREARRAAARVASGLAGAEVALEVARRELAAATVRAPFAGVIARVEARAAEAVEGGRLLVEVVDLDPVRVRARAPEGELRWLAPGAPAAVRFPALDATLEGRVTAVDPVVDPESGTGGVTIVVPNPEGRILPGMYARARIDGRTFTDRLTVPAEAIVEREGRALVFVFRPDPAAAAGTGSAEWVWVEPGATNGERVALREDGEGPPPAPGALVVTAGRATLVHGARVRIVR